MTMQVQVTTVGMVAQVVLAPTSIVPLPTALMVLTLTFKLVAIIATGTGKQGT